ncbi:MAG: TlpA family protein disulfide reductase [Bryobacterales bacterium]|nr:TlpA family protein disulfide reductase [Bryobacterales bacterium]
MIYRRSFLMTLGPAALALPSIGVPDFAGKSLDGARFSKASLLGKPLLIQFWATWCGYCRGDQPAVDEIVERYRGRLAVLAVSVREERATVQKYLARSPRKSRIVLTEDSNLVALFNPRGFPYYALLNAEGRMVGEQRGAGGKEGLQQMLARVGLRD